MTDIAELNTDDFSGVPIDHLGLVADKIDDLEIIRHIDERLALQPGCGVKVTMGERVAAMILNGLGFIDTRLYLFPEFLQKKPVERLFGKALKAEWFNDDALGRCLDAISAYGVTKLFTEISFKIGLKKGLLGKSAHFDTSTLQLAGDYERYESEEAMQLAEEQAIPLPARGYSKSHRHDLKQMVITLATTGKAHFPIWMESQSGNASDQRVLAEAAERMRALCKGLSEAPDFLYVGDSALYANILAYSQEMKWLTRVPETIAEARQWTQQADTLIDWKPLCEGYRYALRASNYGKVAQRWVMIFSEAAYQREIKTLTRKIAKARAELEKSWWHLSCQRFECETDAKQAIKALSKTMKYHQVQTELKAVLSHAGRGRPKKTALPTQTGYQIAYTITEDAEKINVIQSRKGRFILSTNELDTQKLPDTALLSEYKKQSGTESGFKFIKDNAFQVDSVFLKTAGRIDALMMIMTLCLMVYGVSQYALRQALEAAGDSIPNQLKKPTQRPSLKWVYFLFLGVHELSMTQGNRTRTMVINVTGGLRKILGYFGPRARAIYLNST
jgi:transposase